MKLNWSKFSAQLFLFTILFFFLGIFIWIVTSGTGSQHGWIPSYGGFILGSRMASIGMIIGGIITFTGFLKELFSKVA